MVTPPLPTTTTTGAKLTTVPTGQSMTTATTTTTATATVQSRNSQLLQQSSQSTAEQSVIPDESTLKEIHKLLERMKQKNVPKDNLVYGALFEILRRKDTLSNKVSNDQRLTQQQMPSSATTAAPSHPFPYHVPSAMTFTPTTTSVTTGTTAMRQQSYSHMNQQFLYNHMIIQQQQLQQQRFTSVTSNQTPTAASTQLQPIDDNEKKQLMEQVKSLTQRIDFLEKAKFDSPTEKEDNVLVGMSLEQVMSRYRKFDLEKICSRLGLKRNGDKEVIATRIVNYYQEQKSRTKNQEKRNANSPSMSQREKKKASNCRKEGSSTKRVEEESDSEAELDSESEEEEEEEEEEDDEALDKQNKKYERNRESNKRRRPGHHRKTPKKRKY